MANTVNFKPRKSVLRFKKLSRNAYIPTKASEFSAGFDLYAAHDGKVRSKGKTLIKTDLQLQIPEGCYGRVAPRSGLAVNHAIDVGAGVIDADYRGNVGIVLFNFGDLDYQVKKGDRIAQLICEKISYPELEEVSEDEELESTERGACGFGSSGLN